MSFSGEMIIFAFLLGSLVLPIKKSDKDMKDKRLAKSYKSHKRATKLPLLSCSRRCLSKLQEIQI